MSSVFLGECVNHKATVADDMAPSSSCGMTYLVLSFHGKTNVPVKMEPSEKMCLTESPD